MTFVGFIIGIGLMVLIQMLSFGSFVPIPGSSPWIVFGLSTSIMVLLAYIAAAASLLTQTGLAPPPFALADTLTELFMRGIVIAATATVNIVALSAFGLFWLAAPLAILVFLSVFPPVARSAIYQGFLGWSSWLMPFSWLATGVGLLFFVIDVILSPFFAIAVRLDPTTGTIETSGGFIAVVVRSFSASAGFDVGNFSFLTPPVGTPPAAAQGPFTASSISTHETGHCLNVAALGPIFHYVGAMDENPPFLARGALAYAELVAESHFPGTIHLRVWS